MDELIDILDANGNSTGKTALKSVAHKNGWFHPTTHIWFYTTKGEVLLQQRSKNKNTHPLLWDVSVAGHIGAGENILDAALREINEEIGIQVNNNDLTKIGCIKEVHQHTNGILDCEYHHTFTCELKTPFYQLNKQESEVAALQLMSLKQLEAELEDETLKKKYVPHFDGYYKLVIEAISEKVVTG